MVKVGKSIFGRTALGVGLSWLSLFIIGLIMVLVPLKKVNEDEMTKEEAKKYLGVGGTLLAITLLLAFGVLISVLVLVLAWYIPM